MKRLIRTIVVVFFLTSGVGFPLVSASAAVKVGSKCTKVNELVKSNGKIFACTKSGSKLIWKAASAAQIAKFKAQELAKTKNILGSKGPGGGIVFYDAGSAQPWGRYLELAPDGWIHDGDPRYPDPYTNWCHFMGDSFGPTPATGTAIGTGASNTDLIVKMCTEGAAVDARAYRGGGKSDWFLPSKDELNALCYFVNGQTPATSPGGCGNGKRILNVEQEYWSSSAVSDYSAWTQSMFDGTSSAGFWHSASLYITTSMRPIRAF